MTPKYVNRTFRNCLIYLQSPLLELEIDELLQVCCDELVYDKNNHNHKNCHDRQWHICEPNSVSTFKIRRQPVDYHSYDDEQENI